MTQALVISKRHKLPKDDQTDTNFITPLRMYFYGSKSTLDSLIRSVFNVFSRKLLLIEQFRVAVEELSKKTRVSIKTFERCVDRNPKKCFFGLLLVNVMSLHYRCFFFLKKKRELQFKKVSCLLGLHSHSFCFLFGHDLLAVSLVKLPK